MNIIEERGPWKVLSKKKIYESPWVMLEHHDIIHPGNEQGIYSVIHFQNRAMGVIPLDENYNTWIVGQYRYPINRYSWEIPEGGVPFHEEPLKGIQRELLEETGITATSWQHILTMHLSNSSTDEIGLIYVARDLSFQSSNPDSDEELVVRKLPFEELYQMVINGEVTDSMAVAGVLRVKLMIGKGEL
jgi:ADP-ribose pyrophosphatase